MKYILPIFFLLAISVKAAGQTVLKETDKLKEPIAIAEFGAASSTGLSSGSSFGYNISVEFTPIEDWLELEVGVTPTFAPNLKERDIDLLFKKPWTLSSKVEFMLGAGPAWTHTTDHGLTTNSASGEIALDFMFWPWAKRKFGLYFEPGYEYNFGTGHEQSIGISAGLLVPIR